VSSNNTLKYDANDRLRNMIDAPGTTATVTRASGDESDQPDEEGRWAEARATSAQWPS